jgi:nitrous oxidase accessory protein NosD
MQLHRKLVSLCVLTALLTFTFSMSLRVQKAETSGTIHIRANGSVEGTDKIVSSDNVTYTFIDDINDSIVVERDNIVVDGASYTAQGTGSGIGIDLSNRSNVTIKDMEIMKLDSGIGASGCCNTTISGNNITDNCWNGIELTWYSSYNSIIGNNITANNSSGVVLTTYSSYNNISKNNIADNKGYGHLPFRVLFQQNLS